MCTPKPPKVDPVPQRAATVLPNGGDPTIRAADRQRRRLTGADISSASSLGAPITTSMLGMTGNG